MTVDFAAVRIMNRLFPCVLLSTALLACEKDDQAGPPIYRHCPVEWRGALATDSNALNVQVCWNGRCSSSIPVQAVRSDAGVAGSSDAGCVPTTRGGLPSHCDVVPSTPEPGCGLGEIGRDFSVLACAESGRDGITVDIVLTAASDSFPNDGDRFELVIVTTTGSALVDSAVNLGSDDLATNSSSCRGGLFELDGTPIAE
jgi:hypothetical protein